MTPGTPVHKNGQHSDIWTWLTFISLYNQWLRVCSVTVSNRSAAQNIKSGDGQAGFRSSGPVRCTGPQRHPSLPPSVIHELTHSCGCGPAPALAARSPQLLGRSVRRPRSSHQCLDQAKFNGLLVSVHTPHTPPHTLGERMHTPTQLCCSRPGVHTRTHTHACT